MSRSRRSLPEGFTPWPNDAEFGSAGFSFKRGELRGELHPFRDEASSLTRWKGYLWRGSDRADVLVETTADNHWDAGANLVALAEEIT